MLDIFVHSMFSRWMRNILPHTVILPPSQAILLEQASIDALAAGLQRMPDDQWREYQGFSANRGDMAQADWEKALMRPPPKQAQGSWSDRIIISQDMQVRDEGSCSTVTMKDMHKLVGHIASAASVCGEFGCKGMR
jgi:hypothetical protein